MKKLNWFLLLVLLLGAGVRAIDVWRPVDRPSWRECDVAGIARAYDREGMNLFYPRVDWRGDTPGYAEMEFPVYPWLIAWGYKLFGFHEPFGRIINFAFSLLTLLVFYKLAKYLLPPWGTVAAALFFTFNPLLINVSNSLQPEGLMFLCYVLAGYWFIRWLDNESRWHLFGACIATAAAILAKATAAHIGLFFALLLLGKYGLAALGQLRLWLFAVGALLPGALWYRHAHQFWLQHGNSLGVSNEYHWAGLDLFTNPSFVLGIARSELLYVWMLTGVWLAGMALLWNWREKPVKYGVGWFVATLVYYLIAARTTGDQWAAYYHIVSVPGAALLIGSGVEALRQLKLEGQWTRAWRIAGLASLFGIVALQARQIAVDARHWQASPLRACAASFAEIIPADDLLLVTGGVCRDEGYPVAYNASFMLYWADRKGFNVCIGEQSLESVAGFIKRGAKYYLAAKSTFRQKKQLEEDLRRTYPVRAECDDYCLFQLKPHDVRD
ncbi:MAG TPA: glycosyltransferase family 39 protein [Blastocatellia bacterium]|nr:glycosyltransferase family 39 protein [Blastocatellia bacterium]